MDLSDIKSKLKTCGNELLDIREELEVGTDPQLLLERTLDLVGIHISITNDMATYLMLRNGHYTEKEITSTPFLN